MTGKFAGSEIVEIGIQIEKNGRDFYGALCSKTKNEKTKEVFAELMRAEERHISDFKKVLDSVSRYEPKAAFPDEYFSYMNSLAGDYVFTKKNAGKETAAKTRTDKEAVLMAMDFEKDSIVFFGAMKKLIPESDLHMLDELIRQEEEHLKELYDIRDRL